MTEFISIFVHCFSLKDLNCLTYFLYLKPSWQILGSSSHKKRTFVKKTNTLKAKETSSSLSSIKSLHLNNGSPLTDATRYRQVPSSMQYFSLTWLNISFVINKLSQFMHQPTVIHWPVVKRVLRYLKGTITYSLLHQQSPLHLHAFVNANKVGDPKDHTSTFVYVIFLGVNLIS